MIIASPYLYLLDPHHKHLFQSAGEAFREADDICLGCKRTRAEIDAAASKIDRHEGSHTNALRLGSASASYQTKAIRAADDDRVILVRDEWLSAQQARELAVILLTAAIESER